MFTETLTLPDGHRIPQLALGTWLIEDENAADAVCSALSLGYRHIDTAQAYENERGVGEGLRKSGIKRSDVFVTSKVFAEIKNYKDAARSIDESLEKLGLDYIDLMLIHCPQPWYEYNIKEDRYLEGNREVWRAMEEACEAGKLRSIGVSNFLECDLENILSAAKIKPVVNQIECHIGETPFKLIDWCTEKGIMIESYSPIAHGDALNSSEIKAVAEKYGVSVAQLCIRYCIELGTIVLPKATGAEHQKMNADVNFKISPEDMEILKKIQSL